MNEKKERKESTLHFGIKTSLTFIGVNWDGVRELWTTSSISYNDGTVFLLFWTGFAVIGTFELSERAIIYFDLILRKRH